MPGLSDSLFGGRTTLLQVDDGVNPPVTDTAELTITNAPPTITLTGAGTADPGVSYTLNLAVSDPGPDTVTDWVINWGDGDVQTINSNPASVDHTYDRGGFTYNITPSSIDEDGTWAADWNGDYEADGISYTTWITAFDSLTNRATLSAPLTVDVVRDEILPLVEKLEAGSG